jgi:hypothetical protein
LVCGGAQEPNGDPERTKERQQALLMVNSCSDAPRLFSALSPTITPSRACLRLSPTIPGLAQPAGSIPAPSMVPLADAVFCLSPLAKVEESNHWMSREINHVWSAFPQLSFLPDHLGRPKNSSVLGIDCGCCQRPKRHHCLSI